MYPVLILFSLCITVQNKDVLTHEVYFELFCRDMVDIERFLRETAEKEAEAKSRLQVALNSSVICSLYCHSLVTFSLVWFPDVHRVVAGTSRPCRETVTAAQLTHASQPLHAPQQQIHTHRCVRRPVHTRRGLPTWTRATRPQPGRQQWQHHHRQDAGNHRQPGEN